MKHNYPSQAHNKFAYPKGVCRWLRVINDDNGEYYDVVISPGSGFNNQIGIANNIHILSGYYTYEMDVNFHWTRCILYYRKDRKLLFSNNGEKPVGFYFDDASKDRVLFHSVNEDWSFKEESEDWLFNQQQT